jgi:hypothetical protein
LSGGQLVGFPFSQMRGSGINSLTIFALSDA